jgi:hypothetical protein
LRWDDGDGTIVPAPALFAHTSKWSVNMIGKILGAAIGRRIAGPNSEGKGTVLGYFAPAIARRISPPIAIALAGGYAVKKVWDWRRNRRTA